MTPPLENVTTDRARFIFGMESQESQTNNDVKVASASSINLFHFISIYLSIKQELEHKTYQYK